MQDVKNEGRPQFTPRTVHPSTWHKFSTVTQQRGTVSDMIFIYPTSPTNHHQAINVVPRSGCPCALPGWTQPLGHTQNHTHTRRLRHAPLLLHSEFLLRLQRLSSQNAPPSLLQLLLALSMPLPPLTRTRKIQTSAAKAHSLGTMTEASEPSAPW